MKRSSISRYLFTFLAAVIFALPASFGQAGGYVSPSAVLSGGSPTFINVTATSVTSGTVNATTYLVGGVAASSTNLLSDSAGLVRYATAGTFTTIQNFGTVGWQFNGTGSGTTNVIPPVTAGSFNLTLPAITGNDTFATLGLGQTFSAATSVSAAFTANSYKTGTNCAAVGTAANPSVVGCSAAAAGAFSCATNASGGTCQVSTSVITNNSEILLIDNADEGTRLGVTCNIVVNTGAFVSSKVNATGFTLTLPAFITNPMCFDYVVFN